MVKRMLDLLYSGDVAGAIDALSLELWKKYVHTDILCYCCPYPSRSDLTTMLLLIAVAEGEQL